MRGPQSDLSSRISLRAVAFAVVFIFAAMILSIIFLSAVGLGAVDLFDPLSMQTGFWLGLFAAWILTCYIGGYIASFASRSADPKVGGLYGLVTWATASVSGFCIAALVTDQIYIGLSPTLAGPLFLWVTFLAGASALGAAVFGGILAATSTAESTVPELNQVRDRKGFEQSFVKP